MTAGAAELALLHDAPAAHDVKRRLPVLPVAALLQSQHTLTAVERFAKRHDAGDLPAQAKYYRDLIPLERPERGQQYAFDVDLDACTGCKACVAACHNLNGLDPDELWRSVGLLHGGTPNAPAQQTVTSSCHHCVDPACMKGCPVQAYEKDPVTGIVKHLDDQCFGCQYCTLMCPYDAPKYNKARGIVRKCDMCSDRLAHGEAPACVQACPNEAIAIRIVDQASVIESCEAQAFLPGAPAPDHTLPTTTYRTERRMPANMLPADFRVTRPEHGHPPLVIMLTLTQLSVGAFVIGLVIERVTGNPAGSPIVQTAVACALSFVALAASVFHLGRPWLAWRAVLGLKTSWLSREALAFGIFAQLATAYGLLVAAPILPNFPGKAALAASAPAVQVAAALTGALGVFFSVMVYVATRRAHWSGTQTGMRFFGSMLALGAAAVVTVSTITDPASIADVRAVRALVWLVIGTMSIKLVSETALLGHVRDSGQSAFKRVASVMLGDLQPFTLARFTLALIGGIGIPLALLSRALPRPELGAVSACMLLLLLVSELCERYLFFRAAPASRMPGSIR